MSKRRSVFIVLLAGLCILVLSTVVLAQEDVPAPYTGLKNPFAWNDARAQTAGRAIFRKNCFVCHGDLGNEVVEVNFSTADFRKELESRPDFFFWKVSEGVPGKEMKSWKSTLSETERWQVLTYVWSLGSAAPAPETPVVVGNITAPVTPATPGINATPGTPAPPGTPPIPGTPAVPVIPATPATPGANVAPVTPATVPAPISVSAQARADIGESLFTGKTIFTNKGPSCLSCHNNMAVGYFGGGTVGKDLTGVYSDYGEGGLTSLLKKLRFPVMKAVYADKPLTDLEIAHLTLFLKGTSGAQLPSTPNSAIFFVAGAAGALLLIILFQLLWRQRLSGVRRQLVKGDST